jgi:hypothetical protein
LGAQREKFFPVEPVQSLFGPYPDVSCPVLQHAGHEAVAKPIAYIYDLDRHFMSGLFTGTKHTASRKPHKKQQKGRPDHRSKITQYQVM